MKRGILVCVVLLLSACAYVTPESYGRLDIGMTAEQVEGVLGNPDECENQLGARECIWTRQSSEVRVSYVDGVVVLYSQKGLLSVPDDE